MSISHRDPVLFLSLVCGLLCAGCPAKPEGAETGDSADSAESADTADTADSGESGDSEETADTADTTDTADSGPVPFVDEDFESGADGTTADGFGCFACINGTCDETISSTFPYSGARSLYTTGSNNANLYCDATGFNADFSFSAWFYDDGIRGDELRLFFHEAPDPDGSDGVGIGFEPTTCGVGRYCGIAYLFATGVDQTVDLGARATGWHEITASAVYSSPTDIAWEVCVNDALSGTCGALTTTGYAVGTFRLHHDSNDTYLDQFLAWNL